MAAVNNYKIQHSKAAVLDLGSNSLKLVNYNIGHDNNYKPYHQESIRVKLGEGLENGIIKEKYIVKTIETLKLFRNIIDFEQIEYVVSVATSAARDAKNKAELLEQISRYTGFSFKILSEKEEAIYSYVGAIRSLKVPTAVFFDIGGGSLEIVYAKNYEIQKVLSLPLGSLRLKQIFSEKNDSFSRNDFIKMKKYIVSLLPSKEELGIKENDFPVIGVGGTLRAITKYDQKLKNYPLSKLHNYKLSFDSLSEINEQLSNLSYNAIEKIDSIGSGRSETIQSGSCVITELIRKLGKSEIIVSAQGLREGTLAVSLQSSTAFSNNQKMDAQKVYDVIYLASHPDMLSEYVEDLVRLLFSMNLISEHERVLLAQSISQINQLSSFRDVDNVLYSILDDDSSLTHREQLVVALSLIFSKKKKKAESLIVKYESLLEPTDKKLIKKISSIVSLCDVFHKTGTKVKPLSIDSVLHLNVYPSKNTFPEFLFNQACEKLGNTLEISVKSSIFYHKQVDSDSKPLGIT